VLGEPPAAVVAVRYPRARARAKAKAKAGQTPKDLVPLQPHCSRGVHPGGICVYVVQREPNP
jgi:hypothetical protein